VSLPPVLLRKRQGFTLIELLIVVAIIAVLSAIAIINMQFATERANRAANISNLRVILIALQTYRVDHLLLPPADREAGPFESHLPSFTEVGNGPAAGGSWDGVPWLLFTQNYLSSPEVLFNPRYKSLYRGGQTLRGGWARYHNFRYAYNSSALSTGGNLGGAGNIDTGRVWLVRDLFVGPQQGFQASSFPSFPADYRFPWSEGDLILGAEHALYADGTVRLVRGGTEQILP
jgi:prepilin-type N-terminal cleavage/methylation domain-containing protein